MKQMVSFKVTWKTMGTAETKWVAYKPRGRGNRGNPLSYPRIHTRNKKSKKETKCFNIVKAMNILVTLTVLQ